MDDHISEEDNEHEEDYPIFTMRSDVITAIFKEAKYVRKKFGKKIYRAVIYLVSTIAMFPICHV